MPDAGVAEKPSPCPARIAERRSNPGIGDRPCLNGDVTAMHPIKTMASSGNRRNPGIGDTCVSSEKARVIQETELPRVCSPKAKDLFDKKFGKMIQNTPRFTEKAFEFNLVDLFDEREGILPLVELVNRAKAQKNIFWAGEKHAQKILEHYLDTAEVVNQNMFFPGTMRKNHFEKLSIPMIGMSGGKITLDYVWLGCEVLQKMTVFVALK